MIAIAMKSTGAVRMERNSRALPYACLELIPLPAPFVFTGLMLAAFTVLPSVAPNGSGVVVSGVILAFVPASFLTGLGWILSGHKLIGAALLVVRAITLALAVSLAVWWSSGSCSGRSCFDYRAAGASLGIFLALVPLPLISAVGLYWTGGGVAIRPSR